jgi:hypothetical protein
MEILKRKGNKPTQLKQEQKMNDITNGSEILKIVARMTAGH